MSSETRWITETSSCSFSSKGSLKNKCSAARQTAVVFCGQEIMQEINLLCCVPECVNRLTPNDPYMGRTAPLTSKRCILYIYSTNIGTEYFKHALYSPF